MYRISDGNSAAATLYHRCAVEIIRDWYLDHTDGGLCPAGARYYEIVGVVPAPDVEEMVSGLTRYAGFVRLALQAAGGEVLPVLTVDEELAR